MENTRKPWEQQEGEPDSAYARFCVYRDLGPSRTIEDAYKQHSGKAKKGAKRQYISGQWSRDSIAYDWVKRATRFDIEMFSTTGIQVVTRWYKSLDIISQKALKNLLENKVKPKGWSESVDATVRIGAFIPAETASRIRAEIEENTDANTGNQVASDSAPGTDRT